MASLHQIGGETQGSREARDDLESLAEWMMNNYQLSGNQASGQSASSFHAANSANIYGNTILSDQAHAHLGNVYQFYSSHGHAEQQKLLRNLQNQVSELRQGQLDRDTQLQQMMHILTTANVPIRDKSHSTAGDTSELSTAYIGDLVSKFPSANSLEQNFQLRDSIAKRLPPTASSSLSTTCYLDQLKHWISMTGSGMLLFQTDLRSESSTKSLVMEILWILRAPSCPIIWHLSPAAPSEDSANLIEDIQSLISQVWRRDSTIVNSAAKTFDTTKLQSQGSAQQWISFLQHILEHTPRCFMVIETQVQPMQSCDDLGHFSRLLATLKELTRNTANTGRILKVLYVAYGYEMPQASVDEDSANAVLCNIRATPIPPARARQMAACQRLQLYQQMGTPVLELG